MKLAWTWWLAWGLAAFVAALLVATAVLDNVTPDPASSSNGGWSDTILALAFLAFAVVGALVASRQPRNAVGWLFIAVPLAGFAAGFSEVYAFRGYVVDPGSLPAAGLFAWLYAWTWFAALCAITGIVLLFPDGRPPTRRWRPLVWACAGVWPAVLLGVALHAGAIEANDPRWPDNPLGLIHFEGLLAVVRMATVALLIATLVGVVVSVVFRWRRSRGVERQQLKWMLYAVGLLIAHIVLSETLAVRLGVPDPVVNLAFGIAIAAFPVAAGVAMLRYRLYDVDVVIRKTLVYGSITVVLGATYIGLVLAGQAVFAAFTGGSDLAIAVSTLLVAALFLPLRSRVQRVVDRRFYRRRYDAQRTLEVFGVRLREQIDVESLSADLGAAVTETMEPAHVSLWHRPLGSR